MTVFFYVSSASVKNLKDYSRILIIFILNNIRLMFSGSPLLPIDLNIGIERTSPSASVGMLVGRVRS